MESSEGMSGRSSWRGPRLGLSIGDRGGLNISVSVRVGYDEEKDFFKKGKRFILLAPTVVEIFG